MKVLFSILCSIAVLAVSAQTTEGLVAYYNFNDLTTNDQTGSGSNGQSINTPTYTCGVDGAGLRLDGTTDEVLFLGSISNYFENDDLTFSFFMHPTAVLNPLVTQTIFSKVETCGDENYFFIRYSPTANSVSVEMSESVTKRVVLTANLDSGNCWQHVTVLRRGTTVMLYINGVLRETGTTLSRIDMSNNAVLHLAGGNCVGVIDNPYGGVVDDFRVYERALDDDEVEGLYTPLIPDNIITSDTTVFLGNDVQIVSGNTCAEIITWSPIDDLDNALIANPLISPQQTGVYYVNFSNVELGCEATDSIRITVIDPADLDCTKAFLPNAFTPNGDGRNDTYGISNPYAVSDLVSFEIFDRWGARVFLTTDSMEQWDGRFKGQPLNPGVLLYKLIYRCKGEEIVDLGSLSIIR